MGTSQQTSGSGRASLRSPLGPVITGARRQLAGCVLHVHGTCHGFDGSISTEWEGHAFLGSDQVDAFDEVAKHQALVRLSIAGTSAS